jgi:hypothetical protein
VPDTYGSYNAAGRMSVLEILDEPPAVDEPPPAAARRGESPGELPVASTWAQKLAKFQAYPDKGGLVIKLTRGVWYRWRYFDTSDPEFDARWLLVGPHVRISRSGCGNIRAGRLTELVGGCQIAVVDTAKWEWSRRFVSGEQGSE